MSAITAGPVAGRRSTGWWLAFGGIAATIVVLDQLAKAWVVGGFGLASPYATPDLPGGPTRVLGDLVRIARTHNDGGIFGLLGDSAPVLAMASLFVIAVIVLVEARQGRGDPLLTIGLGLLLGGALGNLVDRLRYGYVVDFVDMGIGDLRWYTFNVADAAISAAIVVLLAHGILGDRLGRLVGHTSRAGPG
jgi:signal peptidase II